MNRTKISYLDYTWNPLAMRCTPISEGCAHCWHIRMTKRMAGNPRFPDEVRAAYRGESAPVLIEKRLQEPLSLRKPSRIGVQFMGDLFHQDVGYNIHQTLWDTMLFTPQHTYLLLTKRADNMLATLDSLVVEYGVLPNIWGLVTAENQKQADLRIPLLLQSPFAVRGVSIEPMLGAVDLDYPCLAYHSLDLADTADTMREYGERFFVICGAETGPGARTMQLSWAYDVMRQCKAAGVPFFFKSAGKNIAIPADLLVREWPGGAE